MPSTEKLRKYLEQLCFISDADWELFCNKLQRRIFDRKQQILRAGEVEQYVSFIERGIVRYYVTEDDKDITFELAFENSLAAEQLYIRKNKRQMALLKNTAEQRYRQLLQEGSHFIQQVPLKYLASYIGITPQALSRIRARIS